MSGDFGDILGLILFVGTFVAGLAVSGHRLALVTIVVVVGASFGYLVQLQDPADSPARNAFLVGLMFLIDILAALFVRFIVVLIWRAI